MNFSISERLGLHVKTSRWGLRGGAAGSLALHALALAMMLLVVRNVHPATEEPTTIIVFLPPEPAAATPPLSPDFVPLPEEPPPPDFEMADPKLPAPEEAPPPPDFKSLPLPPKPAVRPPPRPAQAAPRPAEPPAEAPAAVATSVAPAIVSPDWNALISAWLAAHRRYPEAARQRGEEGDVTVRFSVAADGSVVEVALVQGSGHAVLDEAALAMLRGAAVPAPGAQATRTVRIRFHLSD